jgi:hypothetical protein
MGLIMKRALIIVATVLVICLLGVAVKWFLVISGTFKTRVVLYAKASDGTEMCVFQEFTGTPEPYKTAFYSRKPGGRWSWFYYDHQDLAWVSGRIVLDMTNKIATVFRGTKEVARFNWARDEFIHILRGTTNGPEETPNMWKTPPIIIK